MKLAFATISLVTLILFAGGIVVRASVEAEQVECQQWKKQADEYNAFFITPWQKAQCDAHNIHVNAAVR